LRAHARQVKRGYRTCPLAPAFGAYGRCGDRRHPPPATLTCRAQLPKLIGRWALPLRAAKEDLAMIDRIGPAIRSMVTLANSRGDKALSSAFAEAAAAYEHYGNLSGTLSDLNSRRQNISGHERAARDWVYNWLRDVEAGVPPRG
jgi:hypothetical protein